MSSAREEILGRVGRILGPGRTPAATAYTAIERPYLRRHHEDGVLDLFAERTADYRATVHRVDPADLPGAVARALTGSRYAVPGGLPAEWLAEVDPARLAHDPGIGELDGLDGVVTGCAVAIAETGTIVLDHGPGQGRRALTLVPDYHLIVVTADQVAPDVPEALERLDPARPLTFISGPSATSDIELNRVEGVHGPRTLEVILTVRSP
ncbi:L-lactate dehydrogenase complex protein LldG [Thermomonospora echinospora]|uniref:L-lactate dehydrogenase complex protein LldG n=1 Tax=Thermomonospora echinospora TaxID=1992 RepID=A0A1H6D4J9_9ACTN|nr:lactate utilization protein C [Thermomonospora echinospora]SEG80279.1 L-lactate dehydrogenase complex protein LldG [Thermomonospora echinospora]